MELEDRIYALMMDALDGELTPAEQSELDAHLEARPSYKAEWQAMLAVDTLLRQSPAMVPAADFAQRTMARLPNQQVRLWVISAVYISLLITGILPLVLGLWVFSQLGDELVEPAFIEMALQSLAEGYQVALAISRAMISAVGGLLVQQPVLLGWLLVLGGIASLWGGIYRQLVSQTRPLSA
ncbi:MAG: zf-HC2 domain-containing protein [Chloroflexota bacterium]